MKTTERPAENERRKGYRFNILDAFIAVVIAAVVIVTLLAYLPSGIFKKSSEKNSISVTYTIEIKNVKRELASGIAVGDPVTEKGTAVRLGNVGAEVEVAPHSQVRYDAASGEVVLDELADYSDLLITITASAAYNASSGYTVNGKRIAVGAAYRLSMPGFEGSGKCISITEVAGNGGTK